MRKGALARPARNKLLAEMTDEVAGLVLANNYEQTLALSLASQRGLPDIAHQGRFMSALEARGLLDRAVENAAVAGSPCRARGARRAADAGGTRRAARLCQDRAVFRHRRQRPARRSAFRPRPDGLLPRRAWRRNTRPKSPGTGCAARSSRAFWSTISSTAAGRPSSTGCRRRRGRTAADVVRAFAVVRDGFALPALYAEIDALDNESTARRSSTSIRR